MPRRHRPHGWSGSTGDATAAEVAELADSRCEAVNVWSATDARVPDYTGITNWRHGPALIRRDRQACQNPEPNPVDRAR